MIGLKIKVQVTARFCEVAPAVHLLTALQSIKCKIEREMHILKNIIRYIENERSQECGKCLVWQCESCKKIILDGILIQRKS